jgi:integrase
VVTLKKQLKGSKKKTGPNKYEFTVNLGFNPKTEIYERRYLTFYGNDRESDAALRTFIDELENPEIVVAQITLQKWLESWLEDYYKPPNTEKTTYERAVRLVKNNIVPYIGHIPLGELTTEIIQDLYNTLGRIGKITKNKIDGEYRIVKREPLSPRTIKYVHTILNQSLDQAVVMNKVAKNPCKGPDGTSKKGAKPPKDKRKPKEKWVVLSAPELKEFLADERATNHDDYELIYVAAYSGARQSELLGLEEDKILWEWSGIRIEQALHPDKKSEDGFELRPRTKNETSTRDVKLSASAMMMLKRQIEKKKALGIKSTLVFTDKDGAPIKNDNLGHRYSNLAKKLGYPGMTFNHLRHTHITILLASGWYINDVSKRVGHADPSITLSIYAHCLPQGENALVDRWESLVE